MLQMVLLQIESGTFSPNIKIGQHLTYLLLKEKGANFSNTVYMQLPWLKGYKGAQADLCLSEVRTASLNIILLLVQSATPANRTWSALCHFMDGSLLEIQ